MVESGKKTRIQNKQKVTVVDEKAVGWSFLAQEAYLTPDYRRSSAKVYHPLEP